MLATATQRRWPGDSVSRDTGWVDLYNDSKFGRVRYRAKSGVVTLSVVALWGISAAGSWAVGEKIPTEYLPPQGVYAPLAYRQTNSIASAWIPGQNSADDKLYIYTTTAASSTANAIHGLVSWVY